MNTAALFPILAGFAWKGSVVLGLAWLLSMVLRNRSAAMRHLVWTAASAAVLALPLFSVSLPELRVPSFRTIAPQVAALFVANSSAQSEPVSSVVPSRRVESAAHGTTTQIDWRRALLLIWAIGAAASIVQMLLAFAGLWRVRRSSRPSAYTTLGTELARELRLTQPVPVLESAPGTMPMMCGLLRPAILLPPDAQTWPEERRRMVVLHELAHIRRGDVAAQMLARVALIPNWWNPLGWLAWREFVKERERATDDLVLSAGARASDYAAHLLDIARGMQSSSTLAAAAVAMARPSELEGRLVAILDSQTNRKASGRATVIAAIGSAMVLIAPFAAVHAQDQAQVPADIDATMRVAASQKNYEMLEKPAAAFLELRQYDKAKKLLDAAVAIREQLSGSQSVLYGAGLIKLGDLEKKRNHSDDALAFYSKAAQILGGRPEAAPALINIGENMLRAKNYDQAFDYFQKARYADPSNSGPALMWMAVVREREKNPADAEYFYRSALGVEDPNSSVAATALELIAQFLKREGREDEAKVMSDRAETIRKNLGTPAEKESVNVLHIGNGVLPPKLLRKVEPEYTEEARTAQYQGTVTLSTVIGPDGIPRDVRVVRGLDFGLDQNAVSAVQQWQFQPATKDGAAVAVVATIEVNFRVK